MAPKHRPELSPRQEAFARAMIAPGCPGPGAAYKAAGYSVRGTQRTVIARAQRVANLPQVVARVEALRAAAAAAATWSATDVLKRWIDMLEADPTELSKTVRYCCRHCHGIGHAFQWRHEREYAEALAETLDRNTALDAARKPTKPLPTDEGGYGYDRTRDPVSGCRECDGLGEGDDVFVADMRSVSRQARMLYAGAERTKYGVKVVMHDQAAILRDLAKYLGMFVDRVKVGGDSGNPVPLQTAIIPEGMDAIEASRLYKAALGSASK